MRCIFCKQDSSTSVSVEHIIPESLGNIDHVLPVGAVCDGCNQYFARKVERQLLESPMFRLLRADMAIPNKRGRIPSWGITDGRKRPDYRQMGRFLAKVGLEVLAFKTLSVPGWNDELVDHPALDELRRFARYNEGLDWPFTVRSLHPVNAVFKDANQHFELLHEFDILLTRSSEAYLVVSIFGVEMVINLGGRVIPPISTDVRSRTVMQPWPVAALG
jgi:HNH endonuclease